jgi:hypothetical protein
LLYQYLNPVLVSAGERIREKKDATFFAIGLKINHDYLYGWKSKHKGSRIVLAAALLAFQPTYGILPLNRCLNIAKLYVIYM